MNNVDIHQKLMDEVYSKWKLWAVLAISIISIKNNNIFAKIIFVIYTVGYGGDFFWRY